MRGLNGQEGGGGGLPVDVASIWSTNPLPSMPPPHTALPPPPPPTASPELQQHRMGGLRTRQHPPPPPPPPEVVAGLNSAWGIFQQPPPPAPYCTPATTASDRISRTAATPHGRPEDTATPSAATTATRGGSRTQLSLGHFPTAPTAGPKPSTTATSDPTACQWQQ